MENYTFSTKGLDQEEIQFLQICEEMYFDEVVVDKEFIYEAAEKAGYTVGKIPKKILEAFNYFKFCNGRYRMYRQSLKEPMLLSDVLTRRGRGMNMIKSVTCDIDLYSKGENFGLKSSKADGRILNGEGAYLEIIKTSGGNIDLHLKYNNIIGGFFIARLKKDQKFVV